MNEAGPTLTNQERELLDLLSQGLDNHQIGEAMGISEGRVRNILTGKSGLYKRLGPQIDHTSQSSVLRVRLVLWWQQYRVLEAILPAIQDAAQDAQDGL